jgi:hypothetical protein
MSEVAVKAAIREAEASHLSRRPPEEAGALQWVYARVAT